jgi:hypothetical protein
MTTLKYVHSTKGCANLAAAIIGQAAREYSPYNNSVVKFLESQWFEELCEAINREPDYVRRAIREGWGQNHWGPRR